MSRTENSALTQGRPGSKACCLLMAFNAVSYGKCEINLHTRELYARFCREGETVTGAAFWLAGEGDLTKSRAIALDVLQKYPKANIIFVSCSKSVTDFLNNQN